MPFWIPTPQGPQYVDENGNPMPPPVEVLEPQPFNGSVPPSSTEAPGAGVTQPLPVQPAPGPLAAPQLNAPGEPFPPPPPSSVRTGQSFSAGESGTAFAKHPQVVATQGRLNQEMAGAHNRNAAAADTEARFAAAVGGDKASAAREVWNVEGEKEAARAGQFREQARLASMFAAAESTAAGLAAERTSEYRARYEQQLAATAAAAIQPGLKLSAWEGAGAVGSLFAQGFLAAQGTPVADVRGMMSQMIDRHIALQEERIRRGEKLSEGQRVLWDMARSEAGDEADARSRMRGMMMAEAAAVMEATTAQFGSRLAQARGREAAASIRAELNKELATISDRYFTRSMQESGLALDKWKAEMNALQESKRIGIAQQEANTNAAKARAAGKTDPLQGIIFDTTRSGAGKAIARFLPDTPDAKRTELRTRSAKQAAFLARADEYHRLAAEAGKYNGGWGAAMTNDSFAKRARAWRQGLLADYTYAKSGAAASEPEAARHQARFPENTLFSNDSMDSLNRLLGDMEYEVAEAMDLEIGANSVPLSGDEQAGLPSGAVGTFGRSESLRGQLRGDARGEEKSRVKELLKVITGPASTEKGGVTPAKPNPLGVFPTPPANRKGELEYAGNSTVAAAFAEPNWALGMDSLYEMATDPWAGNSALDAYSALDKLADPKNDRQQANYAEALIETIDREREAAGLPRYTVSDFLTE